MVFLPEEIDSRVQELASKKGIKLSRAIREIIIDAFTLPRSVDLAWEIRNLKLVIDELLKQVNKLKSLYEHQELQKEGEST